ncbi:VOC family protein [Spirosoma aerolatum]|uniref:VOC family protein n=1 Tax=Spirosoma aerolatum TaxID=1211326 RepID=UPI0009ACEBA5|nr:glyoxalase/bleomycin resistance/dioxygenase family protein [Spirosoma aerolatum]
MKIVAFELYTVDLPGTRTFYTRQLGLPIVAESTETLTVQVGWTRLTFRAVDEPVAPYHFAINVPVGMLEVCLHSYPLNYLTTNGQEIIELPTWRARASFFHDNNGNLVKFISRNDLSLFNPNLTVDDLFQGISEVGIATECTPTTTRQLMQRFGLPTFRRFAPSPELALLGNDAGLVTVAQVGHPWPFTHTPAAMNHCQVTFEAEPGCPAQTLYCYGVNQLPVSLGKPLFVGTEYIRSKARSIHSMSVFAG